MRKHPWADIVLQTNSTLESAILHYNLDREYRLWQALRCMGREIYGDRAPGIVKNRLYHIKVLAARTGFNTDTIRRWMNSAEQHGFLRVVDNDIHLTGQKALTKKLAAQLMLDWDRVRAAAADDEELAGLPSDWITSPFSFSFTWAEFARGKSRQQMRALICERLSLWLNTKGWSRCILATIARVHRRSTQRWHHRADTHRQARFIGYDFDQFAASMGLRPRDCTDLARSKFASAVVEAERKWAQENGKQPLFTVDAYYGRPMLAMQVSNKYLSRFSTGMAPARALRHDLKDLSAAVGPAQVVPQQQNSPTSLGSLDAIKHGIGHIPDGFRAKFADHFQAVMEDKAVEVLRALGINASPTVYADEPRFEVISNCVYVPSRGWSSSSNYKPRNFLA